MNKPFLSLLLVLLIGSATGVSAQTIADSPANREQQAERYLQAAPPKQYFADMVTKMTASMPEAQRTQMITMFTTRLDMDAITKAMKGALTKRFTAEELKALADFYGSPVGKSAMGKMSDYVGDLMPIVQEQVMKASAAPQTAPTAP